MQKKRYKRPYRKSQLRQIELRPEAVLTLPCKAAAGRINSSKCFCVPGGDLVGS